MNWKVFFVLLAVVVLSGCATVPTGPSVMVMPGNGKSFDTFRADDNECRQWARQQAGTSPGEAANQNLVGGAALGTLLGAGLGAAIGAATGNVGAGLGIGAASGLVGGTALASGPAYAAAYEVQRQYDMAYQQCMHLKGNKIPRRVHSAPPPPPAYPPPPPPPPYGW